MSLRPVTASVVREQASAEEWAVRVDLAAAHRLLAHYGVDDLTYNHLSVRVPDEPDRLLIKAAEVMFGEVTASSLQKYDLDGKPLTPGVTRTLYGGGLVIHAGILKARPDINVVFHTHTPANMGVASQKQGLLPINQHAVRFYNRIAYHDFGGYEFNLAQREPLIRSLGNYKVALLRNHGSLVCDTTIAAAFVAHHYLEMGCKGQIAALAGGSEIVMPPPEVCEFAARQVEERADMAGTKDWGACLRLAERLDPSFRD